MAQLKRGRSIDDGELLSLTCAKGGTSVLADACLSHGYLNDTEARFAFDWGVLLQLGDDLQDVQEDRRHGSATLFSRAAERGLPLDDLVRQLLAFSECTADGIESLPHGDGALKRLLRMSWRSLIVMAVARTHRLFTPAFLAEIEPSSPFRFEFLRARHKRLSGRRGLTASCSSHSSNPQKLISVIFPAPRHGSRQFRLEIDGRWQESVR